MADLLLEIFCEEIPARMQAKAEADLGKALGDALKGAGLGFDALETASGPRRLSVHVTGLPVKSADVAEERKGPKVGSPEQAIAGFLKGAGLTSIDQAEVRSDPKKGDFYVAMLDRPGRLTADVVAEAVPAIIRGFHWPKSMRWGPNSTSEGELRWVRPLQRILCVLDGAIVPFDVDGLASGNETEGHRVHGRGPFTVTGWADYSKQLEGEGHVRLTRDARRDVIAKGIADVCAKAGLTWVEDAGLLEEVTGLAEWPVVVLGDMDPDFLDLPPEVITLSMRTHQKYFAVNDARSGKLAPHFIVVANIDAADGGVKIAEGNARVLSARLSDARFFWEKDKATPLDEMAKKLSTIAFKEELGSLGDKVERVAEMAEWLAEKIDAQAKLARRASELSKADLVSEMVGEFPELQGVMGRYYALEAGEPESVADAIRDHYKPQGPSDAVPTDPVSVAVALADKLDTLVGFWAIDEKPTGSKDPFALRRAALGVVRLALESGIRQSLGQVIRGAYLSLYKNSDIFEVGLNLEPFYDEPHMDGRVFDEWLHAGVWAIFFKYSPEYAAVREEFLSIREGVSCSEEQINAVEIVEGIGRIVSRLDLALMDMSDEARKQFDPVQLNKIQTEQLRAVLVEADYAIVTLVNDLLSFFADRLKQVLRDQGQRHDLIDAVFALGEDDLVLITRRVEALGAFLDTEDGKDLLALYKRASNILAKSVPLPSQGTRPQKDSGSPAKAGAGAGLVVDADLIKKGPKEEQALYAALSNVGEAIVAPLKAEDFAGAMAELARLRAPVDAFFEGVMVNDDDPAVRANRLALLSDVRANLHKVADFSLIEG
ncbi:glycine--tRNA ligase subunit beta [Hyphomonas oceanitis]|uniref:Glycine--tRNA ligase beta subunit n=1 Tax=Hyphomonas oceanitis SCH89 TaxID=1280953 RepID=A0A059GBZ3_9PROT|nr:glycine--tRNA ligase subunit beta [Hyphomonas oceanitis]KDA04090.1 glycyl-tRNA ligase subunit beta [Hyphomonas oceanitis SCH89]